ncbi:sulfur carrier protein ThiS adenylyltransferase [Clostridium cavendishii DSM 21758]|uniref:Sulfur carrier protein ThiS adenylyltransferase n=1 Tax=Clostridium cavendishii DSM 21758 TaxID=1121302 RepID=A0A1M6I6W6_9CLOT|nr:sulfur carrier protein ThiS adenylyltransferase ThiF [Clostridium cavendishii]SHJ30166.1 sulfur carrier protein ThiS adenylyltransferase [Clostridium cavendishii DSM 21758]
MKVEVKGEWLDEKKLEKLIYARNTKGVTEKVKKAKVGIAGAGGLGSNIAISLARLGVGEITIVDFDIIEHSNLNRQQYFISDIGNLKVKVLKSIINKINPFIKVNEVVEKIDERNIKDIFKDVDIIVEAFDVPENKAMLSNYVLTRMRDKYLIAASGMAGYYSSNLITTKKVRDKFYLCGDFENGISDTVGVMAPRVIICANHMANMVLNIILGKEEI